MVKIKRLILTWLLAIVEKLEGTYIGRPKVVKLKDGGEVIIKGVSAEESTRLAELVSGRLETARRFDPPPDTFSQTALGVYEDAGTWYTVEVGYEPTTLNAKVLLIEKAGIYRAEASNKFKVQSLKLKLI